MTASELLLLARTYADSEGLSLTKVSRLACGGNNRIFNRLARGHGCNSRSIEQASRWFREHWPANLPWPEQGGLRHDDPSQRGHCRDH